MEVEKTATPLGSSAGSTARTSIGAQGVTALTITRSDDDTYPIDGLASYSMVAEWAYKLEESPGTDELAQYLNGESGEGWDLVTVIGGDGGGSMNRLVFRRVTTNPTWEQ